MISSRLPERKINSSCNTANRSEKKGTRGGKPSGNSNIQGKTMMLCDIDEKETDGHTAGALPFLKKKGRGLPGKMAEYEDPNLTSSSMDTTRYTHISVYNPKMTQSLAEQALHS